MSPALGQVWTSRHTPGATYELVAHELTSGTTWWWGRLTLPGATAPYMSTLREDELTGQYVPPAPEPRRVILTPEPGDPPASVRRLIDQAYDVLILTESVGEHEALVYRLVTE